MIETKTNIKNEKTSNLYWNIFAYTKKYRVKIKIEDPKKDGKKLADISTSKNNHILEKNYSK
jgi:hypothetical protein